MGSETMWLDPSTRATPRSRSLGSAEKARSCDTILAPVFSGKSMHDRRKPSWSTKSLMTGRSIHLNAFNSGRSALSVRRVFAAGLLFLWIIAKDHFTQVEVPPSSRPAFTYCGRVLLSVVV